jgi:hypothetical protein
MSDFQIVPVHFHKTLKKELESFVKSEKEKQIKNKTYKKITQNQTVIDAVIAYIRRK